MPEARSYPPDGHDLSVPFRCYWTISFEIAVRRSALLRAGLRFTELAGIGAPYLASGEEDLFIHSALTAGLKGRFSDVVVAIHPDYTTGVREASRPGVIRAKGAVQWITLGPVKALVRFPLEAHRAPVAFHKALRLLLQGAVYAARNKKQLCGL